MYWNSPGGQPDPNLPRYRWSLLTAVVVSVVVIGTGFGYMQTTSDDTPSSAEPRHTHIDDDSPSVSPVPTRYDERYTEGDYRFDPLCRDLDWSRFADVYGEEMWSRPVSETYYLEDTDVLCKQETSSDNRVELRAAYLDPDLNHDVPEDDAPNELVRDHADFEESYDGCAEPGAWPEATMCGGKEDGLYPAGFFYVWDDNLVVWIMAEVDDPDVDQPDMDAALEDLIGQIRELTQV